MDTTAHNDRQAAGHVTQTRKVPLARFARGAEQLTHWVDEHGSVVRLISTLPASTDATGVVQRPSESGRG